MSNGPTRPKPKPKTIDDEEEPSLSQPQLQVTWAEKSLPKDRMIRAGEQNSWSIKKRLPMPGYASLEFKIGNKDLLLNAQPSDGDRQSELTVKRRYR